MYRLVTFTLLAALSASLVFGQNYTCHSCEYYDGDGSDPYECVTDPSMVGRVVGCGHGPTFECFSRNKISPADNTIEFSRGCAESINVGCVPDDDNTVCQSTCGSNLCNDDIPVQPYQ